MKKELCLVIFNPDQDVADGDTPVCTLVAFDHDAGKVDVSDFPITVVAAPPDEPATPTELPAEFPVATPPAVAATPVTEPAGDRYVSMEHDQLHGGWIVRAVDPYVTPRARVYYAQADLRHFEHLSLVAYAYDLAARLGVALVIHTKDGYARVELTAAQVQAWAAARKD